MKKLSQEEFNIKANKKHGNKFIYSPYINHRTYIKIECKDCGYKFKQKANNHLNGQGCPKCSGNILPSSKQQFIEKAFVIHGDKFDYSLFHYVNSRTAGNIRCKICNTVFNQRPSAHLQGQGCPACKASKGELALKRVFDKYNIINKPQYRIPEILNELYYDFYLPDHNLLIEFHGIQHFEYVPFFHRNGDDDLDAQKRRDDVVRSNARQFKYNYLEITYRDLKNLSKQEFESFVLNKISCNLKRRRNDLIRR